MNEENRPLSAVFPETDCIRSPAFYIELIWSTIDPIRELLAYS